MRQALWLLLAATTALALAVATVGPAATAAAGFAAVAAMAGMIAATFLWLWWVRATPLALGMALSWAGVAVVTAVSGPTLPLAALPLLTAGAVLHFAVMRRSMSLPHATVAVPAAASALAMLKGFFITKP
jgi:hypothetical protein